MMSFIDRVRSNPKPLRIFLVVAISAYALYLRLVHLHHHTLWGDEYAQLEQMHGSFADLLNAPRLFSFLSGDYYLTYPFFKIFSYNKWGLAIPHIISTLIGFYLLYLICRRYLKTTAGFVITFLVVCFNQTMILHATEVRPYAVLPTLALGVLYVFLRVMEKTPPVLIEKQWPTILFLIITALFHVYGSLMILVAFTFLFLTHRENPRFKESLSKIFQMILIVISAILPIYVLSMLGPHAPWQRQGVQTNTFIPYPWENALVFFKSIVGNLLGNKIFYVLLPAVIIPLFLPLKDRVAQLWLLFILVLLPIGILFGLDISQNYYFVQRQFIWVMPFFALFLGWVWESVLLHFQEKKITGSSRAGV